MKSIKMSKKFVESTLIIGLLLGLGWLVFNVAQASSRSNKVSVTELARSVDAGSISDSQTARLAEQSMDTTNYTLFFPLVLNDYCSSFVYNETLRYNLEAINAVEVWDCNSGQEIVVAVIDTGVDLDHPDLAANLVTGETFVSGTSNPNDDEGHGTHVAGIVAGVANNGGTIGVAPEAKIMPIKVLDSTGSGSLFDVADGVRWAADNGAQIINLSLGAVSNSSTLEDAIDYADSKGVLLVSSAGNCGDGAYRRNGCSYQDQPLYPAALSNVIAVASTDNNNNQSSFSNQGSYIEIAAPGSNVYSTYFGSGYQTLSGTSMAAPHIAGVAALVWSQYPNWNNDEVRVQLRNTATDLGSNGWDEQYGYGLVNAAEAIEATKTTTVAAHLVTPIPPRSDEITSEFVFGEVLLKIKPGFTISNILDTFGLRASEIKVRGSIDNIGVTKLSVPAGQEASLIEQLRQTSKIEFAEPNYTVTIR